MLLRVNHQGLLGFLMHMRYLIAVTQLPTAGMPLTVTLGL
jgi:hypothetical protein